jgi:thiamine biosynthesis protein ThiI
MTQSNYEYILVRYGELTTKGKNRKDFISKLLGNTKVALKEFDQLEYKKTYDRLYIHLNGVNYDDVEVKLKKVFGIISFSPTIRINSDVDEMVKTSLEMAKESSVKTFKMVCKRHDKTFEKNSDEINRLCATEILRNTELKVDVKNPDLKIRIEVREDCTYMMSKMVKGAGGYPVGTAGKALMMTSGGIDSPVAGYMLMKRGIRIDAVHFAAPPYTSNQALNKVVSICNMLSDYQGTVKLHVIPFTDLQLKIYENCDESYAITLMRRMMYRIAERLSSQTNCKVIGNGESIGQVASQTLDSMVTINDVVNIPVLRPIATFDKIEIIDIARKIGTFETSILPYEDCCTIFSPKNPTTKPKIDKCEFYESKFDYDKMIDECIENKKIIFCSGEDKEEDLF